MITVTDFAAMAAASLMVFITIAGMIGMLVSGPFILLSLRRGYWVGVLALLGLCLICAVLFSPLAGGAILLLTGFLVAGVPVLLRRQRPYLEYLVYVTGLALISLLAVMGAYTVLAGESLFTALVAAAERFLTKNQFFTGMLDIYQQSGLITSEIAAGDFNTLVVSYLKDMAAVVPALLLTVSAVAGTLNLMIPYRLSVRKGTEMPLIPPFSRWRLPRGTFLGFLGLGIVAYLLTFINESMGQTVLYTVSSLFIFAYSIQGLCVVAFLFDRSRMSGVLKVILCLLLFAFLSTVLFVVGVFEQFLHLRELLERMKKDR
jgi:uncharacterized protein YybS (DUF2232 family)